MMDGFAVTYWHWWILACALLGLEMLLPGVFFLWLSIAAGVVGVLLLLMPGLELAWQGFLFAALSVSSVIGWRIYMSKYPEDSDQPLLNRRGQQYVGRVFSVIEPIVNGYGRARVGDSIWKVAGPDCPAGTRVKVLSVDENLCLQVEPVEEETTK